MNTFSDRSVKEGKGRVLSGRNWRNYKRFEPASLTFAPACFFFRHINQRCTCLHFLPANHIRYTVLASFSLALRQHHHANLKVDHTALARENRLQLP